MHKGVYLRSPLTVIYMTIVLLALIGALILVTVAMEWLHPVWLQMTLLLQGMALLVSCSRERNTTLALLQAGGLTVGQPTRSCFSPPHWITPRRSGSR